MSFNKEQARIAIIGSGIAGISTAIALKRQLQFENFVIYEKDSDIGGTWRVNTYPGCSSDVAGHWYSLSTDPNPNWSSYFVLQPEILDYWKTLVEKYSLRKHLVTSVNVVAAVWDDAEQRYRLTLKDERTGAEREEVVEAVVSAVGALTTPSYPKDITGMDEFKGSIFHSSRWKHDVSLSGKELGAQLIPRISADTSVQVINFCRTPNWFVYRPNYSYPSWVKWTFTNLPLTLKTYRTLLAARYDLGYLIFRNSNKTLQSFARKNHCEEAPKEHVKKLIPDYPPGCKRIIVDPGYIDSLHRPNVNLTWAGINRITADGIVTKTEETVPLDVIIFATGFDFEVAQKQIHLKGKEGTTLNEYFDSQGGPTAYLGTTVPGFPNFFTLMGPNTATGHASIIFSEEATGADINYALQLLKPIIEKKAQSFTVRASATEAYNAMLQRRLSGSVFTACTSYYRQGATGKNIAIFPGPLLLFWWWTLRPRWDDYEARGAEAWKKERRHKSLLRVLLLIAAVAGCVGFTQPRVKDLIIKSRILDAFSKVWGRLTSTA
ncbi:FAD/NAD-binding domain-containing protein [Phellopilus nigrolimitatus]|nr:FAD/NAD-binding domain-containing protein [Phellopilus nigrolimitatus]